MLHFGREIPVVPPGAEAVKGIDLTLPGRPTSSGALHPLTRLRDRAVQALRRMGFAYAEGPEIETEWYCFDALNTPADHPARNEKDTFYLPDGRLLRTHTSTVQIRTMETAKALIKVAPFLLAYFEKCTPGNAFYETARGLKQRGLLRRERERP